MKKVIYSTLMVMIGLMFSLNAISEEQSNFDGEKFKATIQFMASYLKLTEEQIEAIKPIMKDSVASKQAVMYEIDVIAAIQNDGTDEDGEKVELTSEQKDELRAGGRSLIDQMNEIEEDTLIALNGILSKQQMQKYLKIQSKKHKKAQKRAKEKLGIKKQKEG